MNKNKKIAIYCFAVMLFHFIFNVPLSFSENYKEEYIHPSGNIEVYYNDFGTYGEGHVKIKRKIMSRRRSKSTKGKYLYLGKLNAKSLILL